MVCDLVASGDKCLSLGGGGGFQFSMVNYPNSKLPQVSEGSWASPTGVGVRDIRDLPLPPRGLVQWDPVPTWSSRSANERKGGR